MAEYYTRREMSLHDERIRDNEQLYVSRVRGEGIGNADEFQTLSRSDDHGLLVRGSGTSARFQWNSLFNESRDGSRSENGFASHGRDYDTVVERPVPIVSEGIRNVTAYDPNVDGSRFIGRTRNVARVPIDDVRNYYSVSEREYPQRQSVDEVNGHIGRTRNVIRLPVADGWNYSVREGEYSQRQSLDEENGLMFRSEDGSHSLTPRSQSSGQRTLSRGSSRESLPEEGQYRSVDGIGSSRGIPSSRFSNHRIPSAEGVSPRARGEYAPNVHRSDGYVQPESHRSRDYSLTAVSEVEYDDGHRVQDYHDRGSYGIDVVNATLPSDHYVGIDGIGSSRGIPSSRFSNHRIPSAEGVSPRARGEYAPNVHRSDGYVQPESHRSRDYSLTAVSEVEYDDGHRVQDYHDRGSYGIDAVNATLPSDHYVGNSRRDAVMEEGYSGLHDISRPLQEVPALDNYDGSGIVYEVVYGAINSGPRNSYPDNMTDEIRRILPHEEQFTYEGNTRDMPYEQQYVYCPRQNDEIPLMDGNTRRILDAREITSPELPDSLKRRLVFADETRGAKRIARAVRVVSSYDERHLGGEDENGLELSNRASNQTHHHGESHSRAHTGVSIAEARQPSNGFRKSRKKPLSERGECSKSDVMKRIKFPPAVSRPCAPQLSWPKEAKRSKTSPHVTNTPSSVETYDKAKGTGFKKKFKSVPKPVACPSTAPDPVVLDSGPNINKKQKRAIKDSGSMNDDDLRSQDVDADPVLKVKPLDDLPENSEKFKQSVDEWFFRCMVHLNESISYQKKFKGQGNGCRLKCVICSSFKEFRETKDVATHAFASLKVGYRAQHLGFHRALCVLMGWDSAAAANGHWVCQSLPERVAWTLKEDVIIWPPVVIIQNFQARNCQLNEIGKLSIELQNILKDNGFSREIRACHEKPGNPNIMVVEFMGTLPGLKEAERLHNSFAENKHGRAELAQLDAEVVYCKVADKKPEGTRKLLEKSEDYQYAVDKNEDDQKPVNRIKDEQSVHKTENYQKAIDTRDDEDEPVKIDQQIVDKAEDEQEPIGKDRDDSVSVNMARDDQVPVDVAQGDQEHVEDAQGEQNPVDNSLGVQELAEEAQGEQKPVDNLLGVQELAEEAQREQKPVDNSLGVQELAEDAQGEQKPVNKSLCDQELVEEAQGEQNPVDSSQGDQDQANRPSDTQGLTEIRKDDQESLDKTGYDQEPVVLANKSKDDQEPLDKAGYDQEAVGLADNSKDAQEPLDKTGYDREPVRLADNSKDAQEPLNKTGYDQEPVRLADNSKDAQEPLDKTSYDEEPAGQKEYNQAPVGKKYNTLYGYLGIVEELHRLPNHMKKHHLARSKERFASFNAAI